MNSFVEEIGPMEVVLSMISSPGVEIGQMDEERALGNSFLSGYACPSETTELVHLSYLKSVGLSLGKQPRFWRWMMHSLQ